jgi:hypothetical protein
MWQKYELFISTAKFRSLAVAVENAKRIHYNKLVCGLNTAGRSESLKTLFCRELALTGFEWICY